MSAGDHSSSSELVVCGHPNPYPNSSELVVCGHSLGGGCATLLGVLLNDKVDP